MKKILFAALVATGMMIGAANPGFAHDVKNEHKGCDKAKVCLEKITCGKLDGRIICYPTSCGPANCDTHMHLEKSAKPVKNK